MSKEKSKEKVEEYFREKKKVSSQDLKEKFDSLPISVWDIIEELREEGKVGTFEEDQVKNDFVITWIG